MDLNDILSRRTATKTDELESAVGVTLDAITEIADGAMPHALKLSVLEQVGVLLTNVQLTGVVDPGSLVRTPIAALGSGTPAAPAPTPSPADSVSPDTKAKLEAMARITGQDIDNLVDNLVAMIAPLDGLTIQQVNARANAMAEVADGTIVVKDDGTLKLQEDLDSANRDLTTAQDELRTLTRRVKPMLDPIDALTDDTEKNNRMNAMHNIARNGVPAPTPPDARVTELESIVDDVRNHLRNPRVGGTGKVLETSALSDETKTALGL